jgi:hypothetical protein
MLLEHIKNSYKKIVEHLTPGKKPKAKKDDAYNPSEDEYDSLYGKIFYFRYQFELR